MRKALLAVLALVIAIVAWFALHDDVADDPAGAAPAGDTPAPDAESERGDAARRARARAPDDAEPATDDAPAADPAEPSPGPAPERIAEADAAGVLTVVGPDGAGPLAGVRVGFVEYDNFAPPAGFDAASDRPSWLLAHGRILETDAHGAVLVPKFAKRGVVAARDGGSAGELWLQPSAHAWTLTLHREVVVRAQVRDAEGRPCGGVSVLVVRGAIGASYVLEHAETDATSGIARFADIAPPSGDDSKETSLTVALPFAARPSVAIDPVRPPAEPVVLTLPAAGVVRVVVVGDGGVPAPDGQTVVLRRARAEGEDAPAGDDLDDLDDEDATRGTVADGAAVFPHIGLGLALEVEIPSADGTRRTAKQQFDGPSRAGDEVVVRIAIGAPRPVVAGRVVDGSGGPVAGMRLVGDVLEPGREPSWDGDEKSWSVTDAEGRFRFALDRAPTGGATTKFRLGRRVETANGWWDLRVLALRDLPAGLGAGTTDVGDVVFAAAEVLVAGVVVDEDGRPLEGAVVRAMGADHGTQDAAESRECRTGVDGRFRLEGAARSAQVAVGVTLAARCVAGTAAFPPRTADARIVMAPAGSIAGTVRVPPGFDPSDVRFVAHGPPALNGDAEHALDRDDVQTRPRDDGSFEFASLRSGRASVDVCVGWGPSGIVATFDGVDVVAGTVTRDPRLQDIDLTTYFRTMRVTVHDQDNRPLRGAIVFARTQGSGTAWKRFLSDGEGVATVRLQKRDAASAGVDLVATCEGRRSAYRAGVTADTTLTLPATKPATIRVRLAESTALPAPPCHIAVELHYLAPGVPDDDDGWDPRDVDDDARFTAARVVPFHVVDPGRYRVMLIVWNLDFESGTGSTVETSPKVAMVTVAEGATSAEITVTADPGSLAEELRSLQEE